MRSERRNEMTKIDLSLYLVTDRAGLDDTDFLTKIEQAILGGVSCVQLREKESSSRAFYDLARQVKVVTDSHHVPLIINDRLDIAQAVDASGVHLGQSDLPVTIARKILGPQKIIGISAKTLEQARTAENGGADYLGVGAIFPTTTKVITQSTTLATLKEIAKTVTIPVVAIGGISPDNIAQLKGTGIAGVAVVSALMKSDKPQEAAKALASYQF